MFNEQLAYRLQAATPLHTSNVLGNIGDFNRSIYSVDYDVRFASLAESLYGSHDIERLELHHKRNFEQCSFTQRQLSIESPSLEAPLLSCDLHIRLATAQTDSIFMELG